MLKKMDKYLNPWTIDIWSLGCIILEIVSGLPLWMSIPTKIEGVSQKVSGLFAVKGRLFNKIISKQIDVVENLEYNLKHKVFLYQI
jgi:dual specificity tyrosine-phosphorylation-regulated kinase 2/3/4